MRAPCRTGTAGCFDFVVIGSGFGGSVAALRLAEKGYRVLVLERGRRYADADFARTNWRVWRYLWAPALRWHGILQLSFFRHVVALHGCGVGGGSLGYANVLMEPSDALFAAPAWRDLADWKALLRPHYATARRMLGVTTNPDLGPADAVLREIAADLGRAETFAPVPVGVFFGDAASGAEVPDPYFGGEGPARSPCRRCGGCMIGCRYNAKNTLVKNYLYLAEKRGAQIRAECEVRDVRPLAETADGARYLVLARRSTSWLPRRVAPIRARNVVFAGGALGTLRLLFRCRDVTRSLPRLSPRLGDLVRTNSEALLGVTSRSRGTDYSRGVAITSLIRPDDATAIEPVRYPAGSSLMRFLAWPLLRPARGPARLLASIGRFVTHPIDYLRVYGLSGWAQRSTILLVMQVADTRLRLRLGRGLATLFRRDLISEADAEHAVAAHLAVGHAVTRRFARKTGGIALGSVLEGLLSIPMSAHLLGGCPIGRDAREGVVDLGCRVHGYPGLYIADGSVVPANPGINPSLTIAALAEYTMNAIPARETTA